MHSPNKVSGYTLILDDGCTFYFHSSGMKEMIRLSDVEIDDRISFDNTIDGIHFIHASDKSPFNYISSKPYIVTKKEWYIDIDEFGKFRNVCVEVKDEATEQIWIWTTKEYLTRLEKQK